MQDELPGSDLTAADVHTITAKVCELYTAPPAQQQQMWNNALNRAVEIGFLKPADRVALQPVLADAGALDAWNPTGVLGQQLDEGAEEAQASTGNSGVGFVVGGVIGGIIGFAAAGPAGIGVGIAVGGAAGNLAETVVNLEEDNGESGGDG